MSENETTATRASPQDNISQSYTVGTEPSQTASEASPANGWYGINTGLELTQLSTKAIQRSMEQAAAFFGLADGAEQGRKTATSITHNLNAIAQSHSAYANGGHGLIGIWTDAIHAGVNRNMENVKRLAGCRTLVEIGVVQSDMMRQLVEAMIQSNLRFLENSVQVTRDAAERCRQASSND